MLEALEEALGAPDLWEPGVPLMVFCDGRQVEDLDRPLRAGAHVVVMPRTADPVTVFVVNVLLIAAAAFATYYLTARALEELKPQERNDEASPSYSFQGIATEYRQGFFVPTVFGERDVGGQAIATQVGLAQGMIFGGAEEAGFLLALSEGRVESIAGLTGNNQGEANNIQPPPDSILANGNILAGFPDARISIRTGTLRQTPVPGFNGDPKVTAIGVQSTGVPSTLQFTQQFGTADDLLASVRFLVRFPNGLYEQDNTGATLALSWAGTMKLRSTVTGQEITRAIGTSGTNRQPFSFFFVVNVPVGMQDVGPWQLEVNGRPEESAGVPALGTGVVAQAVAQNITQFAPFTFAYPRAALIGITFTATEQAQGGRVQFQIPVKGIRVRVFDAGVSATPSDATYWELPASGDPYFGIWSYAPGRNPAWQLATFLTADWGLGEWFSDDQVDWQSIRDWADFCDQDALVDGVAEMAFECSFVADKPDSALAAISSICAAGRATPVFDGNKFRVRYQYANAHGRGSNSIPAKSRTQLFTTSQVRGFSVEYLNHEDRPALLYIEIRNRAKQYSADPIPIEDQNSALNDPTNTNPAIYRKEQQQLRGVVRESQARREGWFIHETNYRVRSRISFLVGAEALAAEVGDLIGMQHHALRPYDEESFAYRLAEASTASTTIKLDHDVTLAGGTTYAVVLRETSGTITQTQITSGAGSYPAGTALTVGNTITAKKGAPVAFGEVVASVQHIVKDYEIVSVKLKQGMMLEVVALEYHPEIHTLPDVGDLDSIQSPPGLLGQSDIFASVASDATDRDVTDIFVAMGDIPGTQRITWQQPQDYGGLAARVYYRRVDVDRWSFLGEFSAPWTDTDALVPGTTYVVTVSMADHLGRFQAAGEGPQVTVTPQEFPPVEVPSVSNLEATAKGDGVLLEWDSVDADGFQFYELRLGSAWAGAQVLGRPREPRAWLTPPPPVHSTSGLSVMVRARMRHGLFSTEIAEVALPAWAPAGAAALVAADVDPSSVGTLSDLTWNATTKELELSSGKTSGTWTSPTSGSFDVGYLVDALWRFGFALRLEDADTVDDDAGEVDDGEGRWSTVDGRDPTPAIPGADLWSTVDDDAGLIDTGSRALTVGGQKGQAGELVSAFLEVQFDTTGDASPDTGWQPYNPERRSARVAQYRLTLRRESTAVQAYAGALRFEVHA